MAWVESGTVCSVPAFIREAGMVHVLVARSISSQVARLASTLRTPVIEMKMRQYLDAHQPPESLMRARALPSWEGGRDLRWVTGSCRPRLLVTLGLAGLLSFRNPLDNAPFHDY